MKIKILGTRGEIEPSAPYHSKHSGILIDNKLLFDIGEKNFLKLKPKNIFVTHIHPDHAFFVLEDIQTKIPIYAPEKHEKVKLFKKKISVGKYKVTPIPTHHSLKVKSQAYLIETGGKKILYTGDIIWINKEYHRLFKNLDLVITDGSFIRKGGLIKKDKKTGRLFGHSGIPDLVNLFKKFTDRIVFVHFGSWFYKNIKKSKIQINKIASDNNIEIIVGYDGQDIVV